MKSDRSEILFNKATDCIPGGVNSPVRAFGSVGRHPIFMAKAKGSRIWDVDGNEYIDYVGSWGPMILGHAHPRITEALRKAIENGTSYGAATELEVEMAEMICSLIPSVEMVRMVNSGTEATMSAIRLARAFTNRDLIVKFEGCYHGHADSFLIKAGSGAMTFGTPNSRGVPRAVANQTLVARFNDLSSVEELFTAKKDEIAAVIVEPVVGNMGCVPPKKGFLAELRALCSRHGALLIFDEVMTGFRLSLGGAQQLYGVTPDLTTLGKIIGGGLPVGAYGGRREIMKMVSPEGPVYQAGTLSGNPLAMTAGIETLRQIKEDSSFYSRLEERGRLLEEGIRANIASSGLALSLNRVGSMFTLFFTGNPVEDFETASLSNTSQFAVYFREMLKLGIFLPPSQFEAAFISSTHSEADIKSTIEANREALKSVR